MDNEEITCCRAAREADQCLRVYDAILRLKQGDVGALGILYRHYHVHVLRWSLGICRRQQMAEDVTQEVFIQLIRAIKRFDTSFRLSPFLFAMMNFATLGAMRKERRNDGSVTIDDERISGLRSPDASPETSVELAEIHQIVHTAVGRLDPELRVVIIAKFFHGNRIAEICESLGLRRGAVFARLRKARERLRQIITDMMEDADEARQRLCRLVIGVLEYSDEWDWETDPDPDTETSAAPRSKRPDQGGSGNASSNIGSSEGGNADAVEPARKPDELRQGESPQVQNIPPRQWPRLGTDDMMPARGGD